MSLLNSSPKNRHPCGLVIDGQDPRKSDHGFIHALQLHQTHTCRDANGHFSFNRSTSCGATKDVNTCQKKYDMDLHMEVKIHFQPNVFVSQNWWLPGRCGSVASHIYIYISLYSKFLRSICLLLPWSFRSAAQPRVNQMPSYIGLMSKANLKASTLLAICFLS